MVAKNPQFPTVAATATAAKQQQQLFSCAKYHVLWRDRFHPLPRELVRPEDGVPVPIGPIGKVLEDADGERVAEVGSGVEDDAGAGAVEVGRTELQKKEELYYISI